MYYTALYIYVVRVEDGLCNNSIIYKSDVKTIVGATASNEASAAEEGELRGRKYWSPEW